MKKNLQTVTIFGSSRPQQGDAEYGTAYALGEALARAGFCVCNGGYGGTMEASARGAKEAGGSTIGVTAEVFGGRSANGWIDQVVSVPTMVDRMLKLVAFGDAYVVLKGGTGTLLELAAVWEFMNKGIISHKPIIVLGQFWDDVVRTLKDELAWEGLENCTRFVRSAPSPEACVALLNESLTRGLNEDAAKLE